nr:MAG TPA: hypothetical protein [Caudoviricetes sp.]
MCKYKSSFISSYRVTRSQSNAGWFRSAHGMR